MVTSAACRREATAAVSLRGSAAAPGVVGDVATDSPAAPIPNTMTMTTEAHAVTALSGRVRPTGNCSWLITPGLSTWVDLHLKSYQARSARCGHLRVLELHVDSTKVPLGSVLAHP